ncbi:MAG: PfkB family carbohydrate kinase [Clostridia bacterium]
MKIISVGDNTADCYIDEKIYFPGGNALNVAVNCKKNGADKVGYLGVFGDDVLADNIKDCLTKYDVSYERSRKVYAHTGQPKVKLIDGDRTFLPGPRNSCQQLFSIKLMKEDVEMISEYEICHTSCFSNLEYELPTLSKICDISFDFSDEFDLDYMKRVCPYLTYGFFSASDKSDSQCVDILKTAKKLGTKIVGVTRGFKGAMFFDGEKIYTQEVKYVKAIDTMGAGDSFIAGFLTSYSDDKNMEKALNYAAITASQTCLVRGGFGNPYPIL